MNTHTLLPGRHARWGGTQDWDSHLKTKCGVFLHDHEIQPWEDEYNNQARSVESFNRSIEMGLMKAAGGNYKIIVPKDGETVYFIKGWDFARTITTIHKPTCKRCLKHWKSP